MKKKWFYDAQTESEEELHKDFPYMQCEFQIVTKDRVINQFRFGATIIQIQLIKSGKSVSVFRHNLTTERAYRF